MINLFITIIFLLQSLLLFLLRYYSLYKFFKQNLLAKIWAISTKQKPKDLLIIRNVARNILPIGFFLFTQFWGAVRVIVFTWMAAIRAWFFSFFLIINASIAAKSNLNFFCSIENLALIYLWVYLGKNTFLGRCM